MIVTRIDWQETWIMTLAVKGVSKWEAAHVFETLYGNQEIDTSVDPVQDAKNFIPITSLARLNSGDARGMDAKYP
jgi:hypothetical protein